MDAGYLKTTSPVLLTVSTFLCKQVASFYNTARKKHKGQTKNVIYLLHKRIKPRSSSFL